MKIELLVNGMRISDDAKRGLGEVFQEKLYSYSLTDWTQEKLVLPSDIKLCGNVFVGFRYDPRSSWELVQNDRGKVLRNGEEPSLAVEFIDRPTYYDTMLPSGKPVQSMGVSCGNHGVSFFVNTHCEYFNDGSNCHFCGLVPTQKRFSDVARQKRVSDVVNAAEAILATGEQVDFIQFSGGSFFDHDREAEFYVPYISSVHAVLEEYGRTDIPLHLTCMPPHDPSLLKAWKNAGLDTVSFDLECPTREFFERYCPGKAITQGYAGIRSSLRHAVDVFGSKSTYSILIEGLEPAETFVKGVQALLDDGVTPTLNIYHHDPFSKVDVGSPNVESLIHMNGEISRLFERYDAQAGRLGCAHYDVGHEIGRGFFR